MGKISPNDAALARCVGSPAVDPFDAYLAQLGVLVQDFWPPIRLHEMENNLSHYVQGACMHCGQPRAAIRGPILINLDSKSVDDFFVHSNCAGSRNVGQAVAYLSIYDVHPDAPPSVN